MIDCLVKFQELLPLHNAEVPSKEKGGEVLPESIDRDHNLRRQTHSSLPHNVEGERAPIATAASGDAGELLPWPDDATSTATLGRWQI